MSRIFTIDLDNDGALTQLRDALNQTSGGRYRTHVIKAAIESLMPMPEPQNIGTTVRSASGIVYTRVPSSQDGRRWYGHLGLRNWEDLHDVTVLSEGWDGTEPGPCR
jgi:hypothetical protein